MKDYDQIKKDYDAVVRMNNTVMEFAQEYLDEFHNYGVAKLEQACITDDEIIIVWSNYIYLESGSDYREMSESVDASYLWNPDWIFDLRAAMFKANSEAVMKRESEKRAEKEAATQERHEQYLKLKEEFED